MVRVVVIKASDSGKKSISTINYMDDSENVLEALVSYKRRYPEDDFGAVFADGKMLVYGGEV